MTSKISAEKQALLDSEGMKKADEENQKARPKVICSRCNELKIEHTKGLCYKCSLEIASKISAEKQALLDAQRMKKADEENQEARPKVICSKCNELKIEHTKGLCYKCSLEIASKISAENQPQGKH